MLQYAAPNAPQTYSRRSSVFAETPARSTDTTSPTYDGHTHGYNIPRPPSTLSQGTTNSEQHRKRSISSLAASNLALDSSPALSQLASLAAQAPAAEMNPNNNGSSDSTRSGTPTTAMNTANPAQYASAPHATAGGNQTGGGPPVCQNCQTSTTPLWRRDESGSVLCNACGLFLKLHGRARPISLKTDVIKSRNRVKTSHPKKRDSNGGAADGLMQAPTPHSNGLYTTDMAAAHQHTLPVTTHHSSSDRSPPSPNSISRSNTPLNHPSSNNGIIAPQHLFDTITLPDSIHPQHHHHHQSSPHLHFSTSQPSPSMDPPPPQTYDALLSLTQTLRTRVSELEVINDLFRGRVAELESSEAEARRSAERSKEEVRRLEGRAMEAEREVERLMRDHAEEGMPERKRVKVDHDDGGVVGGDDEMDGPGEGGGMEEDEGRKEEVDEGMKR